MADVMKMDKNKILNGTFGKVWIDGEKYGNIKSFEAKVSGEYEEVNVSEMMGTKNRYMGYSIEGTMTFHKINSKIAVKCAEGFQTGNIPTFTVIASIEDPAAYGYERIELSDVTFDELTLLAFEVGSLTDEEVPFKAGSFRYLDQIK